MLNPKLNVINLSKNEYQTYARHFSLEGIGINGQKRIKQAKILCIGAGGLASSALLYLASSGIGCIGIIDHDYVKQSNLQRQILYNSQNINQLKVNCAKKHINSINPSCTVNIYPYKLYNHNAINLIKKYDIILDTTDNFQIRYIIDALCYKLHKIHIYGAIQGFEGQISVFNYKSGIKYSDLYPQALNLQSDTCNEIGVLGVLPGIIGILQATEAIKIITGTGAILSGYLLIYNSLTLSFKKIKIRPNIIKNTIKLNKTKHINKSNVISIKHFKNKFLHNHNAILLIDVRQKIEFQANKIINAINIPIKQINNKNQISLIKKYSSKKMILLYCSENSRSIVASKILDKYKIHHYRLQNGINNFNRKERDSNPR